ncbi:MAG: response regulator [Desulfomonile tiedjei]|uniref:Response regulator n=1 Tax=Desulfomonile tiedjei TaxID=2358 RepID=A0A9D6V2V4_9BACT|nr:response regulator [Desulfomonile tiedjei]
MKTVLIVDDNTTLAYFTARSLQKNIQGIEVITAVSCREARAKSAGKSPSVVIVDIKLPDGSGLELVRELSESLPQMRAIVVSGNELPRNVYGRFFGSLKKPYGEEVLLALVRRALDQDLSAAAMSRRDPPGQDRPAPSSGYDRHHVRNRFAGLLAGLRALQGDLKAQADDPPAIRRLAEEDVERLFGIAIELADIVKQNEKRQRGSHE